MKRIHRARAAAAALIGVFALSLASCSTDVVPTAPKAPDVLAPTDPSQLLGIDLGGTIDGVTGTLGGVLSNLTVYKCSTPSYGSVTQTVGPAGGLVRIGPHSLYVPAGALDRSVAITASTTARSFVRVDFQPEGLRFRYPAVLTLSYAHCPTKPLLPRIVYVDNLLSILEVLPALNNVFSNTATTKLHHFSGYAFAD
jgi:hypothetical protein